MVRKAAKRDVQAIIKLLHQVDMVHHVIRPDLFKPNTTKYNEQELEALLEDESKPIFVYDNGQVLGHAFCMFTEVKDDKLLQNIKTLYIDDICVDEKARGKHVGNRLQQHYPECMGRQRSCTKFLQEYGHEGAKDNDGNNVAKGKREEINISKNVVTLQHERTKMTPTFNQYRYELG